MSAFLESGGNSTAKSSECRLDIPEKCNTSKRRQQVYQAQKRHRHHKAKYVKTLEEEVSNLQQMDAVVNAERDVITHHNRQMKELLAKRMLRLRLDTYSSTSAPTQRETTTWTSSSSVSDEYSPSTTTSPRHVAQSPVEGDSWAAVDFILALECPCQRRRFPHDVQPKPGQNPYHSAAEYSPIKCHGHAQTATTTISKHGLTLLERRPQQFHSPFPTLEAIKSLDTMGSSHQSKLQLPHSEIDKLVEMSEKLPLNNEQVTPAQAYAAIRARVPADENLKPCLEALKIPLASIVQCYGFGAFIPADQFWVLLQRAIGTLK